MCKNQDVYIYGKDKLLDFTYVGDCVDGIIRSVKKFSKAKNAVSVNFNGVVRKRKE
ncbi:MAG: hypothetical protein IBV53_07015 [Candidatus Atribacteria bacterium]